MPFAPKIQKDILKALDVAIIPSLQTTDLVQVIAEPPFDFSMVKYRVQRKSFLPNKVHVPLQMIQQWEKEHMLSARMPTFGFVYEGVSYERVGITSAMGRKMKKRGEDIPGIVEIRLPAPGIICYPPFVPHNDGSLALKLPQECSKVLGIKLMGECVQVFLCESTFTNRVASHSLEIDDPKLLQMGLLYIDELRYSERNGARGQLLAFMCRLSRYLHSRKSDIATSAWSNPQMTAQPHLPVAARHQELCNRVMDHVQTHLNTSLSLINIAQHFGISGFYLNQIFTAAQGTTLMRYVTAQRIEVAKEILRLTPERINDVARLVGFSRLSSFSAVFQKHTGMSPTEYRHLERGHK